MSEKLFARLSRIRANSKRGSSDEYAFNEPIIWLSIPDLCFFGRRFSGRKDTRFRLCEEVLKRLLTCLYEQPVHFMNVGILRCGQCKFAIEPLVTQLAFDEMRSKNLSAVTVSE